MSDELELRLSRAARDIEASERATDPHVVTGLRAAVAHRRTTRRVRDSVAALAVVAVLVPGIGLAVGHLHEPAPAVPSPSTSGDPSSSPSPSASPSPTSTSTSTELAGPPTRFEQIDDATLVARLSAPRTGETWTKPVPASAAVAARLGITDASGPPAAYLVGRRGAAKIYVVVGAAAYPWSPIASNAISLLAEIDGSGVRQIGCPSARSTDVCAQDVKLPGVAYDSTTFYDSLTLPTTIRLGDGWFIGTSMTRGSLALPVSAGAYGDGALVANGHDLTYSEVTKVGPLSVLSAVTDGDSSGDDLSYALRMPDGALVVVDPGDVPGGDYDVIRWDDGKTRTARSGMGTDWGLHGPTSAAVHAPGSAICTASQFSPAPHLDPAQWVAAGTTPTGHVVYVPAATNPIAHTIRAAQEAASGTLAPDGSSWLTGIAAGYAFPTDKAFRDADALYAIEGPDGVWQLRIRFDAAAVINECA